MSKVSTLYDQVLVRLSTLFPDKTRLSNPYTPENNNSNFLREGYGLRVDEMNDFLGDYNKISNEQTLTVLITKEVVKCDMDGAAYDISSKELLEDVVTLKKDFFGFDQISIPDTITLVSNGSSTGIEEFVKSKTNYIKIEASFVFRLTEAL